MDRQREAGPNDPFKQSERIINRVQSDMTKQVEKKKKIEEEYIALKLELQRTDEQIQEFETRQNRLVGEMEKRKIEAKRLDEFLQSCTKREAELKEEVLGWKLKNMHRDSVALKELARQTLAEARGFSSGAGSTVGPSHVADRNRLIEEMQASKKPSTGGFGGTRTMAGTQGAARTGTATHGAR